MALQSFTVINPGPNALSISIPGLVPFSVAANAQQTVSIDQGTSVGVTPQGAFSVSNPGPNAVRVSVPGGAPVDVAANAQQQFTAGGVQVGVEPLASGGHGEEH